MTNLEKINIENKKIKSICIELDEIKFITDDNEKYKMFHYQDCCEYPYIDYINGITNLIDNNIVDFDEFSLEETSNESATRTTFRFETTKGVCEISWVVESNGYYSEGIDFVKE